MNRLLRSIRQSIIGEQTQIQTPFGRKPLVYADYTASGRSLQMIEDFIQQRVLPYYANTHTETSFTGAQTTKLREQAREQIRSSVNGQPEDQVIFCGSGATAAINKLIDILNLKLPSSLNERYQLEQQIPEQERPVVFIGPYEHHSNELPWRESICKLVAIPLTEKGQLDITFLEQALNAHKDRSLLIGSFSAASNVTGVKTDVEQVTRLLHRYKALSFWDYAAAGPYVPIDMSGDPSDPEHSLGDSSKDAVFLSPHKFIGGPGTPGVLIAKSKLLQNRVPAMPGGGTVMYVTPEDHRYVDNPERREEGGTPAIIESIRAGLVFKLQQDVGAENIEALEQDFISRATQRWQQNPNIELLGNPSVPRLSITSLRIKHQGRDLHYGFLVALLNDLFGIQARGGCSCAGPYGHSLLNMNMDYSRALEQEMLAGNGVLRPGWVRLNFNYFIDESTFEYLLRAVELIAEHGWRLLPYYQYQKEQGVWSYQQQAMALPTALSDFTAELATTNHSVCDTPLSDFTALGEETLLADNRQKVRYSLPLSESAEALRWFVSPQDIQEIQLA